MRRRKLQVLPLFGQRFLPSLMTEVGWTWLTSKTEILNENDVVFYVLLQVQESVKGKEEANKNQRKAQ